jgi:maltooligosyltrehalose trehalohydrolase
MNAPLPHAASAAAASARRLPVGAEAASEGGVHFRVWAPKCRRVEVVIEAGRGAGEIAELQREDGGHFSGIAGAAAAGSHYRFRLDNGQSFPDPASRFQPAGPHGPSEVVDPARFTWTDAGWRGPSLHGQVIYELHIGSFTRDGTWSAAMRELPALAELGVTLLELMPVADFPGRFGWGYDGVNAFAPTRLYGSPDDFRRFVDRAHSLHLGVLLDVVYNHFGPDGLYLQPFSDGYASTRHKSEWGAMPNFDSEDSGPVREWVLASAEHWIAEYHLDGLRIDATQSIVDDSDPHVLEVLGQRVRSAAGARRLLIVNENEPQDANLVRPLESGGFGLDMIWNDDWHHSAAVAASSQDEAYYADHRGSAQEFVSAAKHGFLFQGQWYRWQGQRRGSPAFDLEPARFVHFLENHDQVANATCGKRLHQLTSAARWRALTALLLLGPQTPMLFQGQEWCTCTPFLFFADHTPEIAAAVQKGRSEFAAQFANLALPEAAGLLSPPHDAASFARCRLDHIERKRDGHRQAWTMHRDLLALRREEAALRRAQRDKHATDGAVLGADAFVLRFFGDHGDDRLLLVNLGKTLHLDPAPEPLLAPPTRSGWRIAWSSQDPQYGGFGSLAPEAAFGDRHVPGRDLPRPFENWRLQGETALLLAPQPENGPTECP